MKKLVFALLMLPLAALAVTDVYAFKLSLRVPRVYDNTKSLGYRKYQTQRLEGTLRVKRAEGLEPVVEIAGLKNRTHKVGGSPVTYRVSTDGVLWHVVGSNRTRKFKTASVKFEIDADPSYNVGADEPDNTLLLCLAGSGSASKLSGYASGQLGCGCYAYGHTSPTRLLYDLCTVVDTAAVWGTWTARFKRTECD